MAHGSASKGSYFQFAAKETPLVVNMCAVADVKLQDDL